jgi:peptidoglycan/LPS O-acetylase OafA/YrhL
MDRQNSFTFLRLTFALAVVFSHAFPLGGFGEDPLSRITGGQAQIGTVSVLGFFVISGWLITASAQRSPISRFALNRASRILPGFIVMHLLVVFALAPAVMLWNHGDILDYWDSLVVGPNSATSYLVANAKIRVTQYPITDVFLHNPGGSAVNGSLWSLAPEMMCYAWLAVLTLARGLRWRFTGAVIFAVVFALHVVGLGNPKALNPLATALEYTNTYGFHLPLFRSAYLAFLAGMTCYQFRDFLRWRGWLAGISAALLVAGCVGGFHAFVWPFALPYLVLYLAHRLPLQYVEKWGDFSYGIYIYAFPLQQLLSAAGVQHWGFIAYFSASVVLAVAAGMASWRWIESPVIKWARSSSPKPARATDVPPAIVSA